MLQRFRRIAIIAVALLATGCAPQAPVEQVQLFGQAFNNVQAATQPLFDDLATAERDLGKRVALGQAQWKPESAGETPPERQKVVLAESAVLPAAGANPTDGHAESAAAGESTVAVDEITTLACVDGSPGWQPTEAKDSSGRDIGFIDEFCLEYSAYFANIGDPPATREFRLAIAVLGKYSEVLLTLAEGRNIEKAKAELHAIGASVAGTIAIIPQAAPVAAGIGPLLKALDPIIEEAAKKQNFRELRQLVAVKADPVFVRVIAALKAAAPSIFDALTKTSADRAPLETEGNPELAATVVQQIEGYRIAVSNYVVLLDELASAHADIVTALKEAENAPLTLGLVADRAQRLNVQANALRDAFVILRRGPPAPSP